MSKKRTALFVIDIQNDLATDTKTRIPHAERIRAAGENILHVARGLLDERRARSSSSESREGSTLPPIIVFVQHEEKPEDGSLVRGTEPWKLVFEPRSGVEEEFLVSKTTRDTFESNPDLAARLRTDGITNITAFGVQSECCVQETCKGAIAAGFEVTLLRGAHSTYDEPAGARSAVEIEGNVEELLQGLGARVVPWDSDDALRF